MCAGVQTTLLESVRTAKAQSPPIWFLVRLEEHWGLVLLTVLLVFC